MRHAHASADGLHGCVAVHAARHGEASGRGFHLHSTEGAVELGLAGCGHDLHATSLWDAGPYSKRVVEAIQEADQRLAALLDHEPVADELDVHRVEGLL